MTSRSFLLLHQCTLSSRLSVMKHHQAAIVLQLATRAAYPFLLWPSTRSRSSDILQR